VGVQLPAALLGKEFHVLHLLKQGLIAHIYCILLVRVIPLVGVQGLWVLAEGATESIHAFIWLVTLLGTNFAAGVGAVVAKVAIPIFVRIASPTERAAGVIIVLVLLRLLLLWVQQEIRPIPQKLFVSLHFGYEGRK